MLLQRRLLVDDSRGVGEPLNETSAGITSYAAEDEACPACRLGGGVSARGVHKLQLRPPAAGLQALRGEAARSFQPLLTAFRALDEAGACKERGRLARKAEFAANEAGREAAEEGQQRRQEQLPGDETKATQFVPGATKAEEAAPGALPENVRLLTLQAVGPAAVFLRLEHCFAVGEDPLLSQPASVDLAGFLVAALGLEYASSVELTLTGNQALEDHEYLDWQTLPTASGASSGAQGKGGDADGGAAVRARAARRARAKTRVFGEEGDGGGQVTLDPMEIRTAIVYLKTPLGEAASQRAAARAAKRQSR